MGNELTTSKNVIGGKKIEMTKEEKERKKAYDMALLEKYAVQIDQLKLEVEKLERAIKLHLPEREVKAQQQDYKTQLATLERNKKVIEERYK